MSQQLPRRGKLVSFPNIMRGPIKCPKCKEAVLGMMVYPLTKYLLPCQHLITPEQEAVIVRDMFRRGL